MVDAKLSPDARAAGIAVLTAAAVAAATALTTWAVEELKRVVEARRSRPGAGHR